jgi:hypothetical protein
MYKIIGGDQKEYGPVSADDVRKWIAEGRLNSQSRIQPEGSADWKALGELPEFANALLGQSAGPSAGVGAKPPTVPGAWSSADVLAQTPRLEIGRCLSRSWELCTANLGLLLGATFLVWIVGLAGQFIPLGGIAVWLFHGVLAGGLCMVFLKRIRGEQTTVGEAFSGFNIAFGQLMLVGVVRQLLTFFSFCLCILPGVYLSVAWLFGIPLVVDKRLEFWTAMELSRKVATRVWFELLGLVFLAYLPTLVVYLIVEIKITGTLTSAMQGVVGSNQVDFNRILHLMMDMAKVALPLALMAKVVVLLNLPFALGALMYAYEDLFGPRQGRTP